MKSFVNIIILIPVYKPTDQLVRVVQDLSRSKFGAILIVNDGSGEEFEPIFDEVSKLENVAILNHAVNLGKGAALKTGLNEILIRHKNASGIVTVDADGQHTVDDVTKVSRVLLQFPDELMIGSRVFSRKSTPLRSWVGNSATKYALRVFIGLQLNDTQSGLRGIPLSLAGDLLKIGSQRYEFELDMLVLCKHRSISIREVPISTIYYDQNQGSHFSPIFDSMRIYFVLLRFFSASLVTAIMDNAVFLLIFGLSSSLAGSQLFGRFCAVLVNYYMVRQYVFVSKQRHSVVFPKYVLLVVLFGLLSYVLIRSANTYLGWSVPVSKILVETALFIANFSIQRELIFTKREA